MRERESVIGIDFKELLLWLSGLEGPHSAEQASRLTPREVLMLQLKFKGRIPFLGGPPQSSLFKTFN